MNRKEFVQQTVANTIATYLHRYCNPWTIEEAQEKCLRDAEKLADQVYGAPVGRVEVVRPPPALPSTTSPSLAKRRRHILQPSAEPLPKRTIDVPPDPPPTPPKDDGDNETISEMIDRLTGGRQ